MDTRNLFGPPPGEVAGWMMFEMKDGEKGILKIRVDVPDDVSDEDVSKLRDIFNENIKRYEAVGFKIRVF